MRRMLRRRLPLLLVPLLLASCGRGDHPFPYLTYENRPRDAAQSFAAMPPAVRAIARIAPPSRRQLDAVPAELTASDGTGLALEKLRVRGVVEGPLAFSELLFTFRNPTDRRLEGRFELALPPGAAVSRFAMKISGSWMEAEVVERARAQQVYETHLHQRVDPAMLEHEAGSRFSARVFPIEPGEAKEILVSYSHELVDPAEPYRVKLVGLPRLESLEIAARVGDRLIRRAERGIVPVRDFEAPVPRSSTDGLRSGQLVVARVAPTIAGEAAPLADLLVLVDTSSSIGRGLADRAADVAALARALAAERGADFHLAIAAFDQTLDPLFDGRAADPAARYLEPLRLRRALGASNLEAALRWAGRAGFRRVLLVSDGVPTAGARDPAALARALGGSVERIDALVPAGTGDPALLAELTARAGRGAGVVLGADRGAADWLRRLERAAAAPIDVAVDGAEWVWPERLEGMQPGDHALVFARVPRGHRPVRLHLRGPAHTSARTLTLADASAPLLAREVAQADIDRRVRQLPGLSADRRAAEERAIMGLSMEHRVLCPLTALLVLQSDADYGRFGLDRRALSDLLAVDATGLRVLRRGGFRAIEQPPVTIQSSGGDGALGTIIGQVIDQKTGEAIPGATLVATSPALQGTQTAISDETGRYVIANLPPGRYAIIVYYADQTIQRTAIVVRRARTTSVAFRIDTSQSAGEVIAIKADPPPVIDQDMSRSVPVPGRTFEATLGAAAGASGDSLGVSVAGSTGLENNYVIDGLNTTGLDLPREEPPVPLAYSGRMLTVMRRIADGEKDAALREALDWRTDAPWDLMALVALGEALEARGSFTLAARAYGSIVDEFPSRADLRRFAAGRLARLAGVADDLQVDVLERAVELRPDQPSGHRMLAFAHLRAGRHRRALDVLLAALGRSDSLGRFERARPLLLQDAGLVAAAYLAREPARRRDIQALLDEQGVLVPMEPSVHFVLTWENDATDLDLHVTRSDQPFSLTAPADAEVGPDVADGFGPEHTDIHGHSREREVHLWVDYQNRAMMGTGFGQVDILEHDGAGRLRAETRPFVVMNEHAAVDLGAYRPRSAAGP
ncbi:MAG TPA: VIT domain-containing protein [Kofleriaceae bacterium]